MIIDYSNLYVTDGSVTIRYATLGDAYSLNTKSAGMRATVNTGNTSWVRLDFRYNGQSPIVEKLGSGIIRHQVCLKLLAQDPCNTLYVGWRFETHEIVVQSKLNPGKSTSKSCGNAGYYDIDPLYYTEQDLEVAKYEQHSILAGIMDDILTVIVNDQPAWIGHLPERVLKLQGPCGMRTDNVDIDFDLFTGLL